MQHLGTQDKATQVAALRQCFDDELRWFIREGIILTHVYDDVWDIIKSVQTYIRRQRNPISQAPTHAQRVLHGCTSRAKLG